MITNLFIKTEKSKPLKAVNTLLVTDSGIAGNVSCSPHRQVLILEENTLLEFGLQPGDLRENIVVKDPIYYLKSGTVITFGNVKIRLTYHCEPCKVISTKVVVKNIVHKRGYLGCFLNVGEINLNDKLVITEEKYEEILYLVKERINWFMNKLNEPINSLDLLNELGLSKSYARALPAMMKSLSEEKKNLILFKGKK